MASIVNSNVATLANLGRGEVIARFDKAMASVLENILDKKTNLKKRKITITAEIEPDCDRETAALKIEVKPVLCPIEPYMSSLYIGRGVTGEIEAHEVYETKAKDSEKEGGATIEVVIDSETARGMRDRQPNEDEEASEEISEEIEEEINGEIDDELDEEIDDL